MKRTFIAFMLFVLALSVCAQTKTRGRYHKRPIAHEIQKVQPAVQDSSYTMVSIDSLVQTKFEGYAFVYHGGLVGLYNTKKQSMVTDFVFMSLKTDCYVQQGKTKMYLFSGVKKDQSAGILFVQCDNDATMFMKDDDKKK